MKHFPHSYKIALIVGMVGLLWIGSGFLVSDDTVAPASLEGGGITAEKEEILRVRAQTFHQQTLSRDVRTTGRTVAMRQSTVGAKVSGQVAKTPVERGTIVKEGDVLIHLDPDDKRARLAEAEQALKQAQIEYEAAKALTSQGFNSKVRFAGSASALETAKANVLKAKIDLENTDIRAPFDGIMQERHVEAGNFVKEGDAVAIVLELNPMRSIGFVTETQVNNLRLGAEGTAKFMNGDQYNGKVTYISAQADPQSRTFRVELSLENAQYRLVEGLTAQMNIKGDTIPAHFIKSSYLVLADDGSVGVRAVEKNTGKVLYYPMQILEGDGQGLWVSGLPEVVDIITVGQEFVTSGQIVEAEYVEAHDAP